MKKLLNFKIDPFLTFSLIFIILFSSVFAFADDGKVGIAFRFSKDGPKVIWLMPNGSAYKAGVKISDTLTEINDNEVNSLNFLQIKDLYSYMKGNIGETIKLNFKRQDGHSYSRNLVREKDPISDLWDMIKQDQKEEEYIEGLKVLAKLKHPDAAGQLIYHYMRGDKIDRDPNKAFLIAKEMADSGFPLFQDILGVEYSSLKNSVVTNDIEKAIYYSKLAADGGEPKGFLSLGFIYLKNKNLLEAEKYFKLAADKNIPEASFEYAIINLNKGNNEIGLRYLNNASDYGHLPSICQLGYLYLYGKNVEKNYKKALEFIETGVAGGDGQCLFNFAFAHEFGWGVEKSELKALKYMELAEKGNFLDAVDQLGKYAEIGLGQAINYAKAVKYYQKGIKKGSKRSYNYLGVMYENGKGVPKDINEAIRLYKIGVEKGDYLAASNLGFIYRLGKQNKQINGPKAIYYFEKANELSVGGGNWLAFKSIAGIYLFGIGGINKNVEKALHLYEDALNFGCGDNCKFELNFISKELDYASSEQVEYAQLLLDKFFENNEKKSDFVSQKVTDKKNITQNLYFFINSSDNEGELFQGQLTSFDNVNAKGVVKSSKVSCEVIAKFTMLTSDVSNAGEVEFNCDDNKLYSGNWNAFEKNGNFLASNDNGDILQGSFLISDKPFALKETKKMATNIPNFGNYKALMIGVNEYKYFPKLYNALNDTNKIGSLLENKFNFEVNYITNPDRETFLIGLSDFLKSSNKEDNLLIYFAGHGYLDKETSTGYWIPVNGEEDNDINWIETDRVTRLLKVSKAKNILVMADSCYSGKLLRGLDLPKSMNDQSTETLSILSNKKSRLAITSGGLEPVLDSGGEKGTSIFASSFIKALKKVGDFTLASSIFQDVRNSVVLEANQTPEFSPVIGSGHDGGDFIFYNTNN